MTAWALTAVLLFGGTVADTALVVCVGLDGHADLEIVATGCCSITAEEPTGHAEPGIASATEGCAGCVDLALDVESLKAASKLFPAPAKTFSRNCAFESPVDTYTASAQAVVSDHDWVSDVLSSVVLLT